MPLMEAFREGFRSSLHLPSIGQIFSAQEVQWMLAGSEQISLKDWQQNTMYINCTADHPVIVMFWGTLQKCTEVQQRLLLQEATGLSSPYSEGFCAFQPKFNIRLISACHAESLRGGGLCFHTCSNTVDVLDTLTEEQLSQYVLSLGAETYRP